MFHIVVTHLIKTRQNENWYGGIEHIIEWDKIRIVQSLGRESTEKRKPQVTQGEGKVLVEKIL